MTPVERMARAIAADMIRQNDYLESDDEGRGFYDDYDNQGYECMPAASKALEAIREPSKAMIEAGALAFAEAAFECGKPSKEALRHAWQVMIDKALSET